MLVYHRYVESIVRTNKLFCSECGMPIKKGSDVIFKLDGKTGKFEGVFGELCGCRKNYEFDVDRDEHPFSVEGHGQS